MKHNEIINMEAGEEMDKLIAERVMGLKLSIRERYIKSSIISKRPQPKQKVIETFAGGYYLKKYSHDISAAWDVVGKLCSVNGCDVVKVCKRDPDLWGEWSCNFGCGADAFADTAPLAICRAALLVVF